MLGSITIHISLMCVTESKIYASQDEDEVNNAEVRAVRCAKA